MNKLISFIFPKVCLLFFTLGLMAQQWDLSVDIQTPDPKAGKENPNILWVVLEDTNPWMSCYGDKVVKTPNIDKLASVGVRFDRAYVTCPVCSPTRSALITGMYQTSIGAHQHYISYRVWRGIEMKQWDPNHLGVKTLPEIFKAAGYYTFNEGKTHYNFVFSPEQLYDRKGENGFKGARDGSEWSGRKKDQPFFGQIQLTGDKYKNPPKIVKPEQVDVPPYYLDHPVYREDIARHYNTILKMDENTGKNMFAPDFNRDFVIAARDRMDYTIDRIRTVVTDRYKYIRNFMTDKPYMQPNFRDGSEYMELMRRMYKEGKLNEVQARNTTG